jgi:DNA-binding MarR family transcriptional regulator
MSSDLPSRAELMESLHQEMRETSARSVLFSQAVAARVGIHPTDLECLDVLSWTGPATAGRLAQITGLTTGAITGVIDRLEKAGFVRREADPSDRRRVIVHVEEIAEQRIGPLFDSMAKSATELLSSYTDEELAVILDFTIRANQLAQQETAKLREQAAAKKATRPAGTADGADSGR